MTGTVPDEAETVLVMNPHSGGADHARVVRDRAEQLGYAIVETKRANHAIELAQMAVRDGADEIVAVGGDGTLNEVITGVHAVDALDAVTVGVVPAGTGNDFATNIGITSIDDAFRALKAGERRRLDLGVIDGRLFINSCVVGITAEASNETSAELKSRLGVLAYVVTAVKLATEFTGLDIRASVVEGSDRKTVWEGSAAVVLVGNGRRFSLSGSEQAHVEDGLFDVTIIEDASSLQLVEDRLGERLLHREGDTLTRLLASSLELDVNQGDPVAFSLDGEIIELGSATLTTRRRAVEMPIGDSYDPVPRIE